MMKLVYFFALLLAVSATLHAQPVRLSGRVTDSAGEPLPGANSGRFPSEYEAGCAAGMLT